MAGLRWLRMLNQPFYADGSVTLYHGDCRDVLPTLESAALVLTDPPYNVSERSGREHTTVGKLKRKDGTARKVWRDFGALDRGFDPALFLTEVTRLLPEGGSLIAFTSEFTLPAYLTSGLNHRSLIYWHKTNPTPAFRQLYVRAVEMAVWQVKGKTGWTFNGGGYVPNVYEGPILAGHSVVNDHEARIHPTQKPEWLMRALITLHSRPGDVVLDPFVGSGTTLRAAKDLGRRAIGIEINERYCELAARRLGQDVFDLAESVG
jgi:site-specific DNA-methyltransferase (adenine-specific)